jgi:uncharacterized cupredoxin-like copper-binding protein
MAREGTAGQAKRRHGPRLYVLAALGLAAVGAAVIAACGGSSGGHPLGATLDSFKIATDQSSVPAGKVTISVTNKAPTDHELVLIRTDTPADQLPVDGQGEASEDGKVGEVEQFSGPNKTKKETFTLKPGRYVLLCNVPTHYQQGMHVALTVQ